MTTPQTGETILMDLEQYENPAKKSKEWSTTVLYSKSSV